MGKPVACDNREVQDGKTCYAYGAPACNACWDRLVSKKLLGPRPDPLNRTERFVLEELLAEARTTVLNVTKLLRENRWDPEGTCFKELQDVMFAYDGYAYRGESGWSTRTAAHTKPYRNGQSITLVPEDHYDPESPEQIEHTLQVARKTRELTAAEELQLAAASKQVQHLHNLKVWGDDPKMMAWLQESKDS